MMLVLAACFAWGINILGESTALNSPDIYYSNKDPVTGEIKLTKGCRAERLRPDGTCDKSITLDSVRRAVPFFDAPKNK